MQLGAGWGGSAIGQKKRALLDLGNREEGWHIHRDSRWSHLSYLPPHTHLAEAVGSSPLSTLAPGHASDASSVSPFFPLSTSPSIFFCNHVLPHIRKLTVWWVPNPTALPPLGMSEWLLKSYRASLQCYLMSKRKRDLEGPRDGIKHH